MFGRRALCDELLGGGAVAVVYAEVVDCEDVVVFGVGEGEERFGEVDARVSDHHGEGAEGGSCVADEVGDGVGGRDVGEVGVSGA